MPSSFDPPVGFEGARRLVGEATGFGLLVESRLPSVYHEYRTPDARSAAELRELRARDASLDEVVAASRHEL